MGLHVTYLDCMDCEDKECIQSHRKEEEMEKRYLDVEPEQIVYIVLESKREGKQNNIIAECRCEKAVVYRMTTVYCFKVLKIVTKTKTTIKAELLMCENANINTGHRKTPNRYPVFTTKEKCLEWIKG
jgi:hypothetical protein